MALKRKEMAKHNIMINNLGLEETKGSQINSLSTKQAEEQIKVEIILELSQSLLIHVVDDDI